MMAQYVISQILEAKANIDFRDIQKKFHINSNNFKIELWKAGEAYPKIKDEIAALRKQLVKKKTARVTMLELGKKRSVMAASAIKAFEQQIKEMEEQINFLDVQKNKDVDKELKIYLRIYIYLKYILLFFDFRF